MQPNYDIFSYKAKGIQSQLGCLDYATLADLQKLFFIFKSMEI